MIVLPLTTEEISTYRTMCINVIVAHVKGMTPPKDGAISTVMGEIEALDKLQPATARKLTAEDTGYVARDIPAGFEE